MGFYVTPDRPACSHQIVWGLQPLMVFPAEKGCQTVLRVPPDRLAKNVGSSDDFSQWGRNLLSGNFVRRSPDRPALSTGRPMWHAKSSSVASN